METKWSKIANSQLEEVETYLFEEFSYNEVIELYDDIEKALELIASGVVVHQDYEYMKGYKKVLVARYNTMVYKLEKDRIYIAGFLNNRKSPKENYQSIKKNTAK